MRKLLNRIAYPLGYKIERISRFQRGIDALLGLQRPFRFVQIGANDGVRFDDLYHVVTRHPCSGIVVEPLPDMFQRLQANYADYPHIIPINKAIHERENALPLYHLSSSAIARYPGWATGIASFDREHLVKHGIRAEDIATQTVECIPLMALLEATTMTNADLLQIDTEGYDSAILGMIDFARFLPRIIKYEHKNMSPRQQMEARRYLETHGYQVANEGSDAVAWRAG